MRGAFAAPSTATLRIRARWSRTPLIGDAPVVVSMTSYGRRLRTVHLALESIGRHREYPDDVIAHRAHRVVVRGGRIAPYATWENLDPGESGPRTFATGTSGVLYPPAMLDALREAGTACTACAPRADDVWVHATAVRSGATVRPVSDGLTSYRAVPGAGLGGLRADNALRGGNDEQIAATYGPDEVALLWDDQRGVTRQQAGSGA